MTTKQELRFAAMRAEAEQKIKWTATKLFSQKTFANTTMQDIASAAGISTGLTYRYFKSKQVLFDAIVQEAIDGLNHVRSLFTSDQEPRKIMLEATAAMLDTINNEPATIDMMLLVTQSIFPKTGQNKLIGQLIKTDNELIAAIKGVIQKGQEQGDFKSGDPQMLAVYYLGTYQGAGMMKAVFEDRYTFPNADIFLRFLLTDK